MIDGVTGWWSGGFAAYFWVITFPTILDGMKHHGAPFALADHSRSWDLIDRMIKNHNDHMKYWCQCDASNLNELLEGNPLDFGLKDPYTLH